MALTSLTHHENCSDKYDINIKPEFLFRFTIESPFNQRLFPHSGIYIWTTKKIDARFRIGFFLTSDGMIARQFTPSSINGPSSPSDNAVAKFLGRRDPVFGQCSDQGHGWHTTFGCHDDGSQVLGYLFWITLKYASPWWTWYQNKLASPMDQRWFGRIRGECEMIVDLVFFTFFLHHFGCFFFHLRCYSSSRYGIWPVWSTMNPRLLGFWAGPNVNYRKFIPRKKKHATRDDVLLCGLVISPFRFD